MSDPPERVRGSMTVARSRDLTCPHRGCVPPELLSASLAGNAPEEMSCNV
jgi:hypothetical protein